MIVLQIKYQPVNVASWRTAYSQKYTTYKQKHYSTRDGQFQASRAGVSAQFPNIQALLMTDNPVLGVPSQLEHARAGHVGKHAGMRPQCPPLGYRLVVSHIDFECLCTAMGLSI